MIDPRPADEVAAEAERSTADILVRSGEAADRIEEILRESERLLNQLRSGK